jgi:DNA methylase.
MVFKDKWEFESDYLEWSYTWLNLCINKLKHNGSLYLMASTQCMPYFDIYLRDRLTILSRIVWYYDSSGVQAKNITVLCTNQFYIVSKTNEIIHLIPQIFW